MTTGSRHGTAKPKPWSLMLFMAGDNDLGDDGDQKLRELSYTGSTSAADVIAQFDRAGIGPVFRQHVLYNQFVDLTTLGETNTGDPGVLTAFITAARDRAPANRSILVIWNHGTGLDVDDPSFPTPMSFHHRGSETAATHPRSKLRQVLREAGRDWEDSIFFSSAVRYLVEVKAIGVDENPFPFPSAPRAAARDYLDNQELREALENGTPLDILALDACLMQTIEIAYELRDVTRFLIASQSNIPRPGWPFGLLVGALQDARKLSTSAMAKRISTNVASRLQEYFTLSALDLQKITPTIKALSALATILTARLKDPKIVDGIYHAQNSAQPFVGSETIDLAHFCQQLTVHCKDSKIQRAASKVIAAVQKLVVHHTVKGILVEDSRGVSIFFPDRGEIEERYGRLAFAQDTPWLDFLRSFLPIIYSDEGSAVSGASATMTEASSAIAANPPVDTHTASTVLRRTPRREIEETLSELRSLAHDTNSRGA